MLQNAKSENAANGGSTTNQRRPRPRAAGASQGGGTACRIIFIRDGQVLRVPILQTSRRAAS
jgi:hypothetical protein